MSDLIPTQFMFATCQVGAEATLKQEILSANPGLRFAFSRPGFLTFKHEGGPLPTSFQPGSRLALPGRTRQRMDADDDGDFDDDDEDTPYPPAALGLLPPPVFARSFGFSLGKVQTVSEILAIARKLKGSDRPLRLHLFARDLHRPDSTPPGVDEQAPVNALHSALMEALAQQPQPDGQPLFHPMSHVSESKAALGDTVLDLVVAPDEPTWIGYHRHSSHHNPYPGGKTPLHAPEHLPSRAWRKAEEARLLFDIPFRMGDTAVELGCAPGGATYRLLSLGVRVVGIDPDKMDPQVLQYGGPSGARLKHLQKPVSEVRREALPTRVDWLLLDVNLAPQVALHSVHRLADLMRPSLLGVLFTLKLNSWKLAEKLPDWLRRISAMGVVSPRVLQLSSNRQEVCVYGLTAKGLTRQEESMM